MIHRIAVFVNVSIFASSACLAIATSNWLALSWVLAAAIWAKTCFAEERRANALAHEVRIMRHILRQVDAVLDANRH